MVAEKASDEMELGAVWALHEFSLLVSQQNRLDLSLKVLRNTLKWLYHKKGSFQNQKMLKFAKAKVGEELATESHQ